MVGWGCNPLTGLSQEAKGEIMPPASCFTLVSYIVSWQEVAKFCILYVSLCYFLTFTPWKLLWKRQNHAIGYHGEIYLRKPVCSWLQCQVFHGSFLEKHEDDTRWQNLFGVMVEVLHQLYYDPTWEITKHPASPVWYEWVLSWNCGLQCSYFPFATLVSLV